MSERISLSEDWINGGPVNFHLYMPISYIQSRVLLGMSNQKARQIWDELYSVLCQWADEPENKADAVPCKQDEIIKPWDNYQCLQSPVALMIILTTSEYPPLMELIGKYPVKLLYGVMALKFSELSGSGGLLSQAVRSTLLNKNDVYGTWALGAAFECISCLNDEIDRTHKEKTESLAIAFKEDILKVKDELLEGRSRSEGTKRGRNKSKEVRKTARMKKDENILQLAKEIWPELGASASKNKVADEIINRWPERYDRSFRVPSKRSITDCLTNKKNICFAR